MKKIAVHSVPRSGSSWLGNIFNSHPDVAFRYQPLFSYAFKDYLTEQSTADEIDLFFKEIEKSKNPFLHQNEGVKKRIRPVFSENKKKTHICYKEVRYHQLLDNMLKKHRTLAVVGLVRNPMATISSWLNAPKEFRTDLGWEVKEEWRRAPRKNANKPEEFNGYEKWKEVVFMFLHLKEKYPTQFYLIQYRKLLYNTIEEVKELFDFCELGFSKQTKQFISESTSRHSSDAYSVFKTKEVDDKWKDNLPKYIFNAMKEDPDFHKLNKIFKWA